MSAGGRALFGGGGLGPVARRRVGVALCGSLRLGRMALGRLGCGGAVRGLDVLGDLSVPSLHHVARQLDQRAVQPVGQVEFERAPVVRDCAGPQQVRPRLHVGLQRPGQRQRAAPRRLGVDALAHVLQKLGRLIPRLLERQLVHVAYGGAPCPAARQVALHHVGPLPGLAAHQDAETRQCLGAVGVPVQHLLVGLDGQPGDGLLGQLVARHAGPPGRIR